MRQLTRADPIVTCADIGRVAIGAVMQLTGLQIALETNRV